MSVDNRRMSADITLMSMAPRPLSPADRPLDMVPIHFHMEVRMAKRFPRTESDIATLAGRVIDGLTNASDLSRCSGIPVSGHNPTNVRTL